MTTVTFVFLTLFTWMVSSGTWLRLDRRTELSHYDEETKSCSSSASFKNAVIHDKTKLTLTHERSPTTSLTSEMNFTQDRIKKDSVLFPGVTLNCMILTGCVNLLQTLKQNGHVCKSKCQQLLPYFLSKTRYVLFTIETQANNDSTHLNHRSICPSSVVPRYVAQCSHITIFVQVDFWKTLDCIFCKACSLEGKILQGFLYRELRPAFPELLVFILSESQTSLMSSEQSKKAYVRICYVQMASKISARHCLKEAFQTQAEGIKFTVYTGRVETVCPADTRTWVAKYFLAAVLLLGIYITRKQISPNRVSPAHGSNSTMVILFTMTLRCFSPLVTIHQRSEWSRIASRISFVVCLSFALGRTVHVLVACRASHTVIKLFCPMQQQLRALHITVLFIWLTFISPISNKNIKQWFEDELAEGNVGSTQRSWAVLEQILPTLYCVLVSLPSLLQSMLTKLNLLSVLLHLQLVACLQNSRVPRKYILVIKINRVI
ncbi:uncharacterized protein LOC126406539 [Epinephelus moara]|uniref:uncharacterized protein LOC126406539 n=1 Tax=Epinephelus moara TaxID=300413 RepID=UPI00214F1C92|nr:uncharacterized protein LOC126406539 [Epinephelus moara]